MKKLLYAKVNTPLGLLYVVSSTRGLCEVVFAKDWKTRRTAIENAGLAQLKAGKTPTLSKAKSQLLQYFGGRRKTFTLPLDLKMGTEFQKESWNALLHIPFGSTWTYKKQADFIGKPKAARAVGSANGRNPLPIIVPCHRVIATQGKLGGFSLGLSVKRKLLDLEAKHSTNLA